MQSEVERIEMTKDRERDVEINDKTCEYCSKAVSMNNDMELHCLKHGRPANDEDTCELWEAYE